MTGLRKDTHVYCTRCKHFEIIEVSDHNFKVFCKYEDECDLFDFEDSTPYSERPHYEQID